MNKYILTTLLIILNYLAACNKMPDDNHLDGQWQLMEIQQEKETKDSLFSQVENKKDSLIYWRIHMDMLFIHTHKALLNGYTNDTAAKFIHKNNHLNITSTYIHWDSRDSLLTDPNTTILEPMGISGNAEDFVIEKLNKNQMVLVSGTKKLVFRKF